MSEFRLTLDSTKSRLLRSVLNEVLNGFAINNFEVVIGKSKTELNNLLVRLGDLSEDSKLELDFSQALAFSNALRESLRELGFNEFHTRTGFGLEEGQRALLELNALFIG